MGHSNASHLVAHDAAPPHAPHRLDMLRPTIVPGRPWAGLRDVAAGIRAAANANDASSSPRGRAGAELTHDHGAVPPGVVLSPMVKVMFLLVKKDGMAAADFHRHWLDVHAPIAAAGAEALRMRRYVQSHAIPSANAANAGEARGWNPNPFHGVAEAWWDSEREMAEAFSCREGMAIGEALERDEQAFLSRNSLVLMVREYLIFDRTRQA